jgi:hypothetical protein
LLASLNSQNRHGGPLLENFFPKPQIEHVSQFDKVDRILSEVVFFAQSFQVVGYGRSDGLSIQFVKLFWVFSYKLPKLFSFVAVAKYDERRFTTS